MQFRLDFYFRVCIRRAINGNIYSCQVRMNGKFSRVYFYIWRRAVVTK